MGLLDKIFSGPEYFPNNSLELRLKAVEKLKDQNKLIEIAKTDNSYLVRSDAVQKITDQDILIDIAKNDEDFIVRTKAVKMITDISVLKDIALNDEEVHVYKEAITGIDDEYILRDIAINAKALFACVEATSKINTEDILIDIAKNSHSGFAVREAIKKINNQEVLVYIAKNNPSSDIRREATSKISDKSVLEDIAKNDSNEFARRDAVKMITDASALRDIALNDEDYIVRTEAVKMISDDEVLWKVILNDSEKSIRKLAYDKTIKAKHFNDFIANSNNFYNDELLEFEKLNSSTPSIYDLGDFEVLIIDSDGNNYTSWEDYNSTLYRRRKSVENRIKYDEKNNPWAGGNNDVNISDGIIFISENFKKRSKLSKYDPHCENVGYGLFLNPTTDRRTERGDYSLCHLNSLKALVINDLNTSNISKDHFDRCTANTIYFNNCNIANAKDISFKRCENLFGLY